MVKVITYGTYDLLHYGHIRLLERAKELGDYLIVGVTADDFDKTRGKINVQQSLMERVEAVRATGIADEIIIEEYEGQKIDDIRKYDVDIFTVGSDWVGKFDYINDYCKVVYLDRTEGISSSELRGKNRAINLGVVGEAEFIHKVINEAEFVNGLHVNAAFTKDASIKERIGFNTDNYYEFLEQVDSIYIRSSPEFHYEQIIEAIKMKKHVLCESPITLDKNQTVELTELAEVNEVILMDAIKTAYSTAYLRLLLLIKSGKIGEIISIDSTCTSLRKNDNAWNGTLEWGPTALLPVFQILGTKYTDCRIISHFTNDRDDFTKMEFIYPKAVASIKVGDGIKSEGELIISGTKGYAYVPAPWWKTDYFEIRYENQSDNKRYFYQLDGEGIRYQLVAFARAIENGKSRSDIDFNVSCAICDTMNLFVNKENVILI